MRSMRFQFRSLRILDLTAQEVATKYNIPSINKRLNNTFVNTLIKIQSDPQDPIKTKLPASLRSKFLTRN